MEKISYTEELSQMAKIDKSNRDRDPRGKFDKEKDDVIVSRPMTDLEAFLIADWEKRNKGKKKNGENIQQS